MLPSDLHRFFFGGCNELGEVYKQWLEKRGQNDWGWNYGLIFFSGSTTLSPPPSSSLWRPKRCQPLHLPIEPVWIHGGQLGGSRAGGAPFPACPPPSPKGWGLPAVRKAYPGWVGLINAKCFSSSVPTHWRGNKMSIILGRAFLKADPTPTPGGPAKGLGAALSSLYPDPFHSTPPPIDRPEFFFQQRSRRRKIWGNVKAGEKTNFVISPDSIWHQKYRWMVLSVGFSAGNINS